MEQFDLRRLTPIFACLVALCLMPFVFSPATLPEVTRLVVFAGVAMTLNLLVGATGLISMGQGLFFGLGAYTAALGTIRFDMGYGSSAMLAIAISVPLSLIVALISLRARHMFFGLLTMAIGQVAFVFVSRNYKLTGGDDGLVGVGLPKWLDNDLAQHYFAVGIFFVVAVVLLRLLASPVGATLGAVRDNPDRVASLGGNPKLYEIAAMMTGGVLATVFGVVWACTEGSVAPDLFSWVTSALLLMMVALGGRSMFLGPLLGTVILEVSRAWLQVRSSNSDLVVGGIVIVCAVFFPEGIGPAIRRLATSLIRRRKPSAPEAQAEAQAEVLS
jgi:branched-chain amino acid transport system permease protein